MNHTAEARMRAPAQLKKRGLESVAFAPPAGHDLDLEVVELEGLLRRISRDVLRRPQRVEFRLLIAVVRGRCVHMIDFERHEAGPGCWLCIMPGQVQQFCFDDRWQGWLLAFRSEFLLSAATELPVQVAMRGAAQAASLRCLRQLHDDLNLDVPREAKQSLLRYQLHALLVRLLVAAGTNPPGHDPMSRHRYERWRHQLEQDFRNYHDVAHFARRLGLSERTLSRVTRQFTDASPKSLISARLSLEARRLLVHTDLPAASIAAELGFDEPTNFAKFFRHHVLCTPGEFRRRFRGA
jgi:AraC-like DNA-binding protein